MSALGAVSSVAVIILVSALMFLGVRDQQRRSRDAQTVSRVRQMQAEIERYRARTASYPSAVSELGTAGADGFGYQAEPSGCGVDRLESCRSYLLRFRLEGDVGTLAGKNCVAKPLELSCSR